MLSLTGQSFESERHQDSPQCFQIVVVVRSLFCFFCVLFSHPITHFWPMCCYRKKFALVGFFFSVLFSWPFLKELKNL